MDLGVTTLQLISYIEIVLFTVHIGEIIINHIICIHGIIISIPLFTVLFHGIIILMKDMVDIIIGISCLDLGATVAI